MKSKNLANHHTNLYVNFLQESLGNLHLSLEDLLPLLATTSPGLVQRIRLQIATHHRHLDALGDQCFRGVGFPFQEYFLEIIGLRLRRLYQVVGERRFATTERCLQ